MIPVLFSGKASATTKFPLTSMPPWPRPVKKKKKNIKGKDWVLHSPMMPADKKNNEITITIFLPKRSVSGPATNMDMRAPMNKKVRTPPMAPNVELV
ncbi:MAG: hypothetical protein ACD_34C00307G0002 [uncultured bacterium]|nr:MAG: hypothetical protein ACD_34C00307G0002 [uncultured bacterium]